MKEGSSRKNRSKFQKKVSNRWEWVLNCRLRHMDQERTQDKNLREERQELTSPADLLDVAYFLDSRKTKQRSKFKIMGINNGGKRKVGLGVGSVL